MFKESSSKRRMLIKNDLLNQQLISANQLAQKYHVSRQTIVGDIALLRAQGEPIIATVNGYRYEKPDELYHGVIACQHTLEQTWLELQTIVDLGGQVLDVVVEHHVYGQLTGTLGIANSADINNFMSRLANGHHRLLSSLTNGIHLHHLACDNEKTLNKIKTELNRLGLLYHGDQA